MRFTRPRERRGGFSDMTPMIDVVLQLIIFFMVTSQFSRMVRSQLDLPEEPGQETAETTAGTLIVDVAPDGQLLVDSRPITYERFLAMVQAEISSVGHPSQVRLLVRADRASATGTINRIATDLAALGVRSWRVGTERPRTGGGGGR